MAILQVLEHPGDAYEQHSQQDAHLANASI